MDKETIDIITSLNSEQSRNMEKLLDLKEERDNLKFKGIQKSMGAGLDAIAIEIRKLNGNIKNNEAKIELLKKETTWWRFFQRNPKATLFFLVIFIIGGFVIIGNDVNSEKIHEIIKQLKFW